MFDALTEAVSAVRIPFTNHRLVLLADDDAKWLEAHLDVEYCDLIHRPGEWAQERRERCYRIARSMGIPEETDE